MLAAHYRFGHLGWLVTLALLSLAPSPAFSQPLPDESVLPGQRPSDTLPPESELPTLRKPSAPSQVEIADPDVGQDSSRPDLPSEAILPTAVQVADNASALEDERHWLRLHSKAHLGRVRSIVFSSDSTRLFIAGDDKHVLVYRRSPEGIFRYERTLRWQIQRGQAGRIYAIDEANGVLAIGGYGAMGSLGEILLFDSATGNLRQALVGSQAGHRQRITSLGFSSGPSPRLVSMDQNGRLLIWREDPDSGRWEPQQLSYDGNQAVSLQLERTLHPVAATSSPVAPVFVDRDNRQQARWRLNVYDDQGRARVITNQGDYLSGLVTSMAATQNHIVAGDAASQLFIWEFDDRWKQRPRIPLEGIAASMDVSADGDRLVVGTGHAGERSIQAWDLASQSPRQQWKRALPKDVLACALSPDGKTLAYSQDDVVVLQSPDSSDAPLTVIRSEMPHLTRVAFSTMRPYRIAFSTQPSGDLDHAFNPGLGQLDHAPANTRNWAQDRASVAGWTVTSNEDQTEWWLAENGQKRGRLPLDPRVEGAVTASQWILVDGVPTAVAIGTAANSNLYVFAMANDGVCQLLRVFRGHMGRIKSIGVSSDRRYLVSCSIDRTIRIWKLSGLDRGAEINRWGATFVEQDGAVSVDTIREAGPLYFRGLRKGDTITELTTIDVVDGKETLQSVGNAAEILDTLRQRGHRKLTGFSYQRGRAPTKSFQSFPAWQPIASLFVDNQREWAFWTPAGVYDASFEGQRLFGWQLNRGVDRRPDFVLAEQLRGFLERPRVMSQLLEAGSTEAAFRAAGVTTPGDWSELIAQQEQLRPKIRINSPGPDQVANERTFQLEATIVVHEGQQLVPPKAFANGVVATQRELLSTRADDTGIHRTYRWRINLPSDSLVYIQVIASTRDQAVSEATLQLRNEAQPSRHQPRMFVLAAGVNDYVDAQVPKLKYAANNAVRFAQTMSQHAAPNYDCRTISLLNQNVTKATWNVTIESLASQLKQSVAADDLLVIFLSGHGVRDVQTGEYYYVTANARFQDVQSRRFEDCLSFADLAAFADIPCRKLVVLDTCHSGAIQPQLQRELKTALRSLQDDLFMTLTASEGGQEAIESSEQQLGRFTNRLLEGLQGSADIQAGNGDGTVQLAELFGYVRNTVAADASADSEFQFPTLGPRELAEHANIPLTRAANQRATAKIRRLESTRELHADFRIKDFITTVSQGRDSTDLER